MRLPKIPHWGITGKVIIITLCVSVGLWLVLGYYQSQQLEELFLEREYQALQKAAADDRRLFDEYAQSIYRSAKLIGGQKRFIDYVEGLPVVAQQPVVKVAHLSQLPVWMPKSSIMRTFYRSRFSLIYDQKGFLRSAYHHLYEHEGDELLPAPLRDSSSMLSKLSHNQAYMTLLAGTPYLIGSERIQTGSGDVTLVMVTPIDNAFLQAVTNVKNHSTVLALIDREGQFVVASSDSAKVEVGDSVAELEHDYLVAAKSFFDYGSSDLSLQLSSFASIIEIRNTIDEMVAESNYQRAVLVLAMMFTFSLISLLFVRRILSLGKAVNYYAQNILGRDVAEQLDGDELDVLHTQLTTLGDEVVVLRNELSAEVELARRMADDLEARTNSLSLSNINLAREVEERKRSEKERDELHTQLQKVQRMDAIGQITGGVAHDFNNILAAILGHVELAELKLGQAEQSGELLRYLGEIKQAGERGRALVASMLLFSRGEAGERLPLLLDKEVGDIISMLRPTISRSIEIRHEKYGEDLVVRFDPIKLQQIVMNLIVNARDSIAQERGVIEVALQRVRVDATTCDSCHEEFAGEYIELSICDSGHGITEEIRDQIFEPFFTTKVVGEGSGMGLSVIHGILHANKGHILLESAHGRGTCFRLLFEAAEERAITRSDEMRRIPRRRGGEPVKRRIVVVDDEIALNHFLADLLEMEGYEVDTFTDPLQALDAIHATPQKFDLVITDQSMPHMSGMELSVAIRELNPDLPIILCTGYSATTNETLAKASGVNEYLTKPIKSRQLLNVMEQLLRERSVSV